MKIHIIGPSGSGKTHFAKKLSLKHKLPHFDLDNLFWDNTSSQYGVKMPDEKRTEMLQAILKKEGWIIEGIYYSWLEESFKLADKIFLLDVPRRVYILSLIKRFIMRKRHSEKHQRETVWTLAEILGWAYRYPEKNLPEIRQCLEKYGHKVIEVHKRSELKNYLS